MIGKIPKNACDVAGVFWCGYLLLYLPNSFFEVVLHFLSLCALMPREKYDFSRGLKRAAKWRILFCMEQFFAIPINQLWAAVAVLGLLWLALGFFLFDMRRRWHMLFGGAAKNQEQILKETLERILRLEATQEELKPRVAMLEKISQMAVQKVAFRRFNPFENTGSDQSFTLVLLDRENNGVIVSSLYMREGVRVYGKEVSGGKAKQPLSEEEQSLLQEAVLNSK